ncbi:MAG: sulfite exporter TauE/SafE family protein [Ruminococcaceae bacterium]|nr:sulfite exporter TauE/SafE family protein [Oscillospiraceae bacterium]
MKKIGNYLLFGTITGLLNGLFGSGGGVAAVLILKKVFGLETKKAHASALMVILPLSVISLVIYLFKADIPIHTALWTSGGGILGGLVGAKLLKKLSALWITRLFGIMMIAAAIRMFFA